MARVCTMVCLCGKGVHYGVPLWQGCALWCASVARVCTMVCLCCKALHNGLVSCRMTPVLGKWNNCFLNSGKQLSCSEDRVVPHGHQSVPLCLLPRSVVKTVLFCYGVYICIIVYMFFPLVISA